MINFKKEKMEIPNESEKIVKEGNISLVLDSYDALFSDFDPRPYSERSISDDFIMEFKRAVKDKEGLEELRLLIPAHLRKISEEAKIKKRLKEHFKKHAHEIGREISAMKKKGIIWFMIGSVLLVISTLLFEYKIGAEGILNFLFTFLSIISQPAGWFISWEGLERIFIGINEKMPEYNFYKKIEQANIYFLNY